MSKPKDKDITNKDNTSSGLPPAKDSDTNTNKPTAQGDLIKRQKQANYFRRKKHKFMNKPKNKNKPLEKPESKHQGENPEILNEIKRLKEENEKLRGSQNSNLNNQQSDNPSSSQVTITPEADGSKNDEQKPKEELSSEKFNDLVIKRLDSEDSTSAWSFRDSMPDPVDERNLQLATASLADINTSTYDRRNPLSSYYFTTEGKMKQKQVSTFRQPKVQNVIHTQSDREVLLSRLKRFGQLNAYGYRPDVINASFRLNLTGRLPSLNTKFIKEVSVDQDTGNLNIKLENHNRALHRFKASTEINKYKTSDNNKAGQKTTFTEEESFDFIFNKQEVSDRIGLAKDFDTIALNSSIIKILRKMNQLAVTDQDFKFTKLINTMEARHLFVNTLTEYSNVGNFLYIMASSIRHAIKNFPYLVNKLMIVDPGIKSIINANSRIKSALQGLLQNINLALNVFPVNKRVKEAYDAMSVPGFLNNSPYDSELNALIAPNFMLEYVKLFSPKQNIQTLSLRGNLAQTSIPFVTGSLLDTLVKLLHTQVLPKSVDDLDKLKTFGSDTRTTKEIASQAIKIDTKDAPHYAKVSPIRFTTFMHALFNEALLAKDSYQNTATSFVSTLLNQADMISLFISECKRLNLFEDTVFEFASVPMVDFREEFKADYHSLSPVLPYLYNNGKLDKEGDIPFFTVQESNQENFRPKQFFKYFEYYDKHVFQVHTKGVITSTPRSNSISTSKIETMYLTSSIIIPWFVTSKEYRDHITAGAKCFGYSTETQTKDHKFYYVPLMFEWSAAYRPELSTALTTTQYAYDVPNTVINENEVLYVSTSCMCPFYNLWDDLGNLLVLKPFNELGIQHAGFAHPQFEYALSQNLAKGPSKRVGAEVNWIYSLFSDNLQYDSLNIEDTMPDAKDIII